MDCTEIVIGVLKRDEKVCLTLRQSHQTFAGNWEFPGGKIEQGETALEALQREFKEELGVETFRWQPLITIPWQYENIAVRLQVFCSTHFTGEPVGCEGQAIRWVAMNALSQITFPAANQGIVTALQLPEHYMISGDFDSNQEALTRLENAFLQGITFCQLRAKDLERTEFIALAQQAILLAHQHDAKILLNGLPDLLKVLPQADGIQLASHAIFNYDTRPIATNKLLGVSTHNPEEIKQALAIGADFILLSPVKETTSHPEMEGMGWKTFAELVANVSVPVFALGGMKGENVILAKQAGAQGVAAISGFWPSE